MAIRSFKRALAVLALLALWGNGPADARDKGYLTPPVNLATVLPGPPAGPVRAEVDVILADQAQASPADLSRARAEDKLSPFLFADVLGSGFTKQALPATAALLADVTDDMRAALAPAKDLWHRPRPPLQDARVTPRVKLPKSSSYPSFHAARGALWAGVLAQAVPACASALTARGWLVGTDRLILGVHFPSDVAAGQTAGAAVLAQLARSPRFATDLAAARAEMAGAHVPANASCSAT